VSLNTMRVEVRFLPQIRIGFGVASPVQGNGGSEDIRLIRLLIPVRCCQDNLVHPWHIQMTINAKSGLDQIQSVRGPGIIVYDHNHKIHLTISNLLVPLCLF
jgi:hypothetical protein